MVFEPVIGQVLKLLGCQGLRLNQRRRALELKMTLQLQRETVELEECSLANRFLQRFGPIEMVRVIPVDLSELQVGPVLYMALGQPKSAVPRLKQLDKSLDAIE